MCWWGYLAAMLFGIAFDSAVTTYQLWDDRSRMSSVTYGSKALVTALFLVLSVVALVIAVTQAK